MGRQTHFELANRLYDGDLRSILEGWRAEGLSFEDIAHKLRENDIRVAGETVRNWSVSLGIHAPAPGVAQ